MKAADRGCMFLGLAWILFCTTAGAGAQDLAARCRTLQLESPQPGFVSTEPINRWEDGLIVGNGTLGVLVSGTPQCQSYSIGHEWLFEPRTPPHPLVPLSEHMDRCRELALAGKGDDAKKLAFQLGQNMGFARIFWTNPLVPAGSLQVRLAEQDQLQTSARAVDWQRGEAVTALKSGAGVIHSRCFASRADKLIAVRLTSPDGGKINARLTLARLIEPGKVPDDNAQDPGITASADWLTLDKDYQLEKPWFGAVRGYRIVARIVRRGGSASVTNGWTEIKNADDVLVLIGLDLYKGRPIDPRGTEKLKARLAAAEADYARLLTRHATIHRALFDRVQLTLGAEQTRPRSSEQWLTDSRVGKIDPKLVEMLFNAARYALISSTGELPPTLQGIWSGTFRPAWSSDFTQDGNVQAVIDSGLCGNFPEATRAYLDYMTRFQHDFRRCARAFHGCDGLWIPSRTSDHGDVQHFSAGWPGLFWFAGAAWTSAYYYDYYLYTADEDFLIRQALPFMLESAAYYEDFLTVERDGKIVFVPSFSPEITPLGKPGVTMNATMDIASTKQLLRNLLALHEAGKVKVDAARVAKWKDMLARMPEYQVGQDGAFKEWLWPGMENNDRHRHASHLYPAWFEVDTDLQRSEKLRAAVTQAIENRLKYRRDKNGAEMAFGLVQKGIAAAHIRDTRHAYECVEWLCNSYWTTALTSTHDPGRIFNVDISGGMPAVIIEMLAQSRSTPAANDQPWTCRIDLLPALPKAWPEGRISGIRARGGFHLDLAWREGKPTAILLRSLRGNRVTVRFADRSVTLDTQPGRTYELARRLIPSSSP